MPTWYLIIISICFLVINIEIWVSIILDYKRRKKDGYKRRYCSLE